MSGFALWRHLPLAGLVLAMVTVLGCLNLRLRNRLGLAIYALILLAMVSGAAVLAFRWSFVTRTAGTTQAPTFAYEKLGLHAVIFSHMFTFCFVLGLLRALRIQMLLEDSVSQFEMADLEQQQESEESFPEPPSYAAAAAAAAPSPSPIFVAAPAYYPQFNGQAFMPQAYPSPVPQFVPVFVDHSGAPISPVRTQ